jgi:hypothetical protein
LGIAPNAKLFISILARFDFQRSLP